MTQHASLKSVSVGARHRNVLKRYERIRQLQNSETLGERTSAFGLPKVKLIKLKVKKSKSTSKEAEAKTETGTKPASQASTASAQQKTASEKPKGKEKS